MSGAADGAVRVVRGLVERGLTVATAESLTGGLVCAALTDVPGASAAVRGAVVAYATAVKADVLGVDAALLAARGAVDADVARAMARGARRVLGADVALATTGVAGPEPQDGHPVGTVYVAVAAGEDVRVERHDVAGNRGAVRAGTVTRALALLEDVLDGGPGAARS